MSERKAAMQVIQADNRLADGGHDLRMGVAEDRAHLPGREVQDLASIAVAHEYAVGGRDDRLRELAGVPEQVFNAGLSHFVHLP